MSNVDSGWAIGALEALIHATDQVAYSNRSGSGGVMVGTHQRSAESEAAEVAEVAHVADQILDHVLPEWRHADDRPTEVRSKARWNHPRDWAGRGGAALRREQELREKLSGGAPQISADQPHTWVWSGARSLGRAGHYRSAVEVAAKKPPAETQIKVRRRDINETDLSKQAFSLDAPAHGKPRLRRRKPDVTDTDKSVQRGAWALPEGVYAGIRNPFNHEDPTDIEEQSAREYLAALSVLARWVDDAEVETAP